MSTLIESLSNYAAELKYEDISERAINTTKQAILDSYGNIICGCFSKESTQIKEYARYLTEGYLSKEQVPLLDVQTSFVSPRAALFYYAADSDYSRITQALKYHRDFGAGKFFARMLGKRLGESGLFDDVDLIVPVPLHWTRQWTRGYNQAEVIARELAATLSAPCRTDLLRRCRRTVTQTRLSGDEKSINVAGAFRATKKAASLASGNGINHILLIDDVFTSGATMGECCKTLRQAFGAQTRISAASLGYAGY